MATTTESFTAGAGQVLYPFTIQYINQSDLKVDIDSTNTTAFTFANATTIQLNSAPATGAEVVIRRDTDVSTIDSTFFPGSSIRSQDLNDNFRQLLFASQEQGGKVPLVNAVFPDDVSLGGNKITDLGTPTASTDGVNKAYSDALDASVRALIATNDAAQTAANNALEIHLDGETWHNTTETLHTGDTWTSNNSKIATSGAIENRITAKIDAAITGDIAGSDGVSITDDGDGTITVGLTDDSVRVVKLDDSDIINTTEQNNGSPAWLDQYLATAGAIAKRHDTIVSLTTPIGSDYETGKYWFQNDNNGTLHVWTGSAWRAITSGGEFLSQPTIIYVDATNGDDTFDGHRIINPKKTIKAAVADAQAGDLIMVNPGVYQETLPIDITVANLSIVGAALRSVFVHPTTATEASMSVDDPNNPGNNVTVDTNMFRVNSGSYIANMTMSGLKATGLRGQHPIDNDTQFGLPQYQGWIAGFYPGSTIVKSPYIHNCTNFADSGINNASFNPNSLGGGNAGDLTSAPTGGGIIVDGNVPSVNSPLRSIVADSFTHVGLDGPGILVVNNGYCQCTSSYAFFTHYHIKALNGGQANLSASTSDFGRFGLVADGRSSSAIFTSTTTAGAAAGAASFTINTPTAAANWFGDTERPQTNMLVDVVDSNGTSTYEIESATSNGAGGWVVSVFRPDPADRSVNLGLEYAVSSGATTSFFLQSMIASSGHTMEYVGSGTNYTALPENGGLPDETKETIQRNNGRIWTVTVNHNGTLKAGNTFKVDQRTGFVTIPSGAIKFNNYVEQSSATGAAFIPAGTTAERDSSPSAGNLRFNTTSSEFEGYDGAAWGTIGGGGASSAGYIETPTTQATSKVIPANTNAAIVGPVAIAPTATITIPASSKLVVLN